MNELSNDMDTMLLTYAKKYGGGGSTATIVSKTLTANGTYNASADEADGYNPVTVNIPSYDEEAF